MAASLQAQAQGHNGMHIAVAPDRGDENILFRFLHVGSCQSFAA
jgi:hypothetical protein